MLDMKFIRENPDLIRQAARKKHIEFDVSKLLNVDERRRKLLAETEKLRAVQNKASNEVAVKTGREKEITIRVLREVKDKLTHKEFELKKVAAEWKQLVLDVPNIPDPSVPEGTSENNNQEIRKWGKVPSSRFRTVNHITLLSRMDNADFERGVKVSGFRGYFLKEDMVLLSMALWQFTIETMRKKGYQPIMTPALVREHNLIGTGHFPQAKDDVYKTQDDLYLAGTAEIPLMGYYAGETLKEEDLPKKFVAFSPCFRREAGSYGRDAQGLFRLHEFFKVEQLILSPADHALSVKLHEELTANSEEIIQALNLPYRVVALCGKELGRAHVKTYDIEVWIPTEKRYRESHSSSYYHDFQTRRLNIRYRARDNRLLFCHSLNNTAIATPRILISIVENYQDKDGSIIVPEVLRKYIGKDIIKAG